MENKIILLALSLAMFVLVIDTTIMNVSITALVEDLNCNVIEVQAAITLYALVMATMMITGGKLGDIWGRKIAFRRGLVVYGTGSLITALSPTIGVLYFGWSLLEGLGAALVLPALQTLVRSNFEGEDRVLVYGLLGGVSASAVALGPIIGGWLTTAYTWRLAFAAEVVIVLIVLFLSRSIIDAVVAPEDKPKLDLVGTALSAFGLGFAVLGILLAGEYGWLWARKPFVVGNIEIAPFGLSIVPIFICIGIITLVLFALWERRVVAKDGDPLIHISMLRDRYISSGLFTQMVQTTLMGGVLFAMALFMQIVLELNAMQTGFLFLPLSIPLLIAALAGSKLAFRIAPKIIVQVGLALSVIGLVILISTLDIDVVGIDLGLGLAVIGIGIGLIASQLMNLVLSMVAPERTSETASLMITSQNLGQSLGTALLGSILIGGLLISSTNLVMESTVIPEELKSDVIMALEQNIRFISTTELKSLLEDVPPDIAAEIIRINEIARISGMKSALLAAAIIGILGLVVSFFLPKKKLVRDEMKTSSLEG
jgi:MFS family permease